MLCPSAANRCDRAGSSANGYRLTGDGTIMAVQFLLNAAPPGGYYTEHADGSALRRTIARVEYHSGAVAERGGRRELQNPMTGRLLLGRDSLQSLAKPMHAAWVAFAANGDCYWPK
jgi:hypothetical protein